MARPKDIGTLAETAVVKALRANGFPHAERRALHGNTDLGDITGCPGLVFEVKGGQAAKTASDGQIVAWLAETEKERNHAVADIGVLVVQRKGIGPANAARWWAVVPVDVLTGEVLDGRGPVWMHLSAMCSFLHYRGYGTPVLTEAAS